MATKTQEQLTIICDGLFLNDTKPQEWNQTFPWEPSVGFHYRLLDENGEPTGEIEKKYLKKKFLWMFQAMGGRNAVGRYFRIEAEHGEIPAKDGKPAKPYVTITPLAEVFSNGNARFLEAPKDGKVNTPGPAEKPKGPVTPGGGKKVDSAVASATVPEKGGPVKPPPADPKKPRPKPNEKFIASCFESGTNQFFRMQDGFTEDGWILNQTHDHAVQMAMTRSGWLNRKMEGEAPEGTVPLLTDQDYKDAIIKWADWFEFIYSQKRWKKTVNRLKSILANLLTTEQVIALVEMAWAKLPLSYYEEVREAARLRIDHLGDPPPAGNHVPTATPEIYEPEGREYFTEEELSTEEPGEPGAGEPPVLVAQGAPDKNEIEWAINGINKYTDIDKLVAFWGNTKPSLQAVEEIRQAMRLWIANLFMSAKYQANVDGIREKFPKELMNAELEKTLHARYAEMLSF